MSLSAIKSRITAAAIANGRNPQDIVLIAVSKMQPDARVEEVLHEGQRVFGENRVQEAAGKWPRFREIFGALELHIIGPLQTNKVRQAMELAQAIHSVDRPKLVHAIARIAGEIGHCPRLFIQVNTGAEPQKAGVLPADTVALVAEARELGLPVEGLMCIPPVDEDPAPHFAMLRDLAAECGLSGLSMGMSDDFETAIAMGATHIRVGSAIFGSRA